MSKFIIYDATGKIIRNGYCQPVDLSLQARVGESVLDVTTSVIYDGTFDGCYVDNAGIVQKRTRLPCTCPANATVGTAVALTAPEGTTVNIDGMNLTTIDNTGADSITFSDAGTYTVSLILWPYLDVSFEVTAS